MLSRIFLLALLSSFFFYTNGERIVCETYFGCENMHLERGMLLTVQSEIPHLSLIGVTGVIDASTLSLLKHINRLDIEGSNIAEIDEGALCSSSNLKRLFISSSILPNITKAHLKNCHTVNETGIADTFIEDDALESMPLEYLTLDNTNVPTSACSSRRLESVELKEIPNMLFTRHTLQHCKHIKNLYLGEIEGVQELAFSHMHQLKELDVVDVPLGRITGNHFTGLTSLTTLSLDNCGITELAYEAFDNLSNLRQLNITNSNMTLNWRHFNSLANLEYMLLKQTTDVALLNEWRFPALTELTIQVYDITFVDFYQLRRNSPNLQRLIFYGNPNICYNETLVRTLESSGDPSFSIAFDRGPASDGFC